MNWLFGLYSDAVAAQRDIYLAFADRIRDYAQTGDWSGLAVFLPMGVVFGAVHALTPGHSKTVIAAYLAGSRIAVRQALLTSLTLSATHIAVSVLIALLSLPLVSVALGSAGRAPLMEDISRGLLGLIGAWMLWRAIRPVAGANHCAARSGMVAGFVAGLIPCPLTFFVMTFAIVRGATMAGVAFAFVMMLGVALTMSAVALLSVLFRESLMHVLASRPRLVETASRLLSFSTGLVLVAVALNEIAGG
ncbi:MAG: sulfite exporter TauE/SafE family protein [Novosphingobium sp.]|nr:sulfite exporter TauE/SafE family protein [Novosphingobium sp.]